MTNEQIEKLDYFDKAQLYHTVYYNKTYSEIPKSLRIFYTADAGLAIVKATISNASIKDPYEIAKLIKALNPSKPQTLQEIYNRAAYIANLCDTSIEKILRSDIFNTKDFIPKMSEEKIKETLKNKNIGSLISLEKEDYTPSQDDDPTPTPTPIPGEGDYATEEKIYFTVDSNFQLKCSKTYQQVISTLPKLPSAELILDSSSDYQNILNISCGYNEEIGQLDFNFIQLYDTTIKMFTIHFKAVGITIEENSFIINNGGA